MEAVNTNVEVIAPEADTLTTRPFSSFVGISGQNSNSMSFSSQLDVMKK